MFVRLLMCLATLASSADGLSAEQTYFGNWKTTNRKLEGEMTCSVVRVDQQTWQGRFYGEWQRVPFDYTVQFSGSPSDLRGAATIDGAAYEWRAVLTRDQFIANFSGDRYIGSFDLTRKQID